MILRITAILLITFLSACSSFSPYPHSEGHETVLGTGPGSHQAEMRNKQATKKEEDEKQDQQ